MRGAMFNDDLDDDLVDAAWHGDAVAVHELLAKVADANAMTNDGGTALEAATQRGRADF